MTRLPSHFVSAALPLALFLVAAPGASPHAPATAPPRDSVLTALFAQVNDLNSVRRWAASDSVAALALDRAEHKQPPDSSAMARALFYRGNTKYWRAQFSDPLSVGFLTRAISIQRRLAHPDVGRWVITLDLLARLYTESGDIDSALVVLAEGRALCRRPVFGADSMLADLWISTGRVHRRAEHYDLAIASYDSARVIRERLNGPENPGVAEALAEIGAVYGRSNRLDEATGPLERAIAMIERTAGPESPTILTPLSELANVQFHAGDIARSIETLERVVEIQTRLNGANSPRLIPPLYNIGLRLFEFGDYAGAEAIFSSLVPRAEASFGPEQSRTSTIRYMAGATAMLLGDTASAAQHITRVRAAMLSKPVDENHNVNMVERYYSMLLARRGDMAGARRALTDGLARERATPEPLSDVIGELLEQQATEQMASFDSLGLDSTMQQLAQQFGDRAHAQGAFYGDYLRLRARAEHWRGRHDLAWDYALRSEEEYRERVLRNVRALPDERGLELAGQSSEPLDLLVSLSSTGGESAIATAWDRVVRWRGMVTAELQARRAPHVASSDTALAAAHTRWVQAVRHGAQLEVADSGPTESAALTLSRAEVESAERHYATLASEHGIARDTARVDLTRIRATLAPGEALVSLVTIAGNTDSARVVGFATSGPGGALERVDLGSARELLAHITAWRGTLETPPASGRERREERECRLLGAQVRARTWDRFAPLLRNANTVVLVADGELADLPWQALPVGRDRYLVDAGPEIQTPGAERELLAAPAPAGRGLLALGDPDFDRTDAPSNAAPLASAGSTQAAAFRGGPSRTPDSTSAVLPRGVSSSCGAASSITLSPLPGARAEASEIAAAWNTTHPGDPATLLVGAAGSERTFKADAPGREVLHIATHGILWGDQCAPVYVGLRGVGGVQPLATKAAARSARPAKSSASAPSAASSANSAPSPNSSPSASTEVHASPWSGRRVWLALAGANHARTGSADENEGLLTANEVVTLDLSDVDWVVLSACQSGVGQEWPLEGSIGMRRAFRLAGARAVIASEWPIADESTREWMRALYAARTGSQTSASHAMRAASRSVLESRRRAHRDTHPFYWAAFTATGR